ncbi:unnamed protein product [Paramecium octaurelia]|uniref:Uncharacterized protein n=1 Tax=Paramecium octaurelia TaxID=43137 RepID=A0A8S1VBJ3_PAROT|nr:unnamed protein product [Paramecium octaurelia]
MRISQGKNGEFDSKQVINLYIKISSLFFSKQRYLKINNIIQSELQVQAKMGFTGKITQGLVLHPDNEVWYKVIVQNIFFIHQILLQQIDIQLQDNKHFYVTDIIYQNRGHDSSISVIIASRTGDYVASRQKTYMGF